MDESLKANLKSHGIWKRLLFMLLFGIIWGVTEIVLSLTVLFLFFHVLFTGRSQGRARHFGRSLGSYFQQIVAFLTFNTEAHPWPFAPWPTVPPEPDADVAQTPGELDQETNVDGD